jgi:DNA-binding transcriptional regulator YiaG
MPTTATTRATEVEWTPGEDLPYVMRLPGQRALALSIPAAWVMRDKSGEICLLPPAINRLDKLRALYSRVDQTMTPGFVRVLREALNATQAEFARRLGVNKMTVSRWERGSSKPSSEILKSIAKVRAGALRKGLLVETEKA